MPAPQQVTSRPPAVVVHDHEHRARGRRQLVAQGNGNTIGCRITVNGVVKDERTVNAVNAYTFCLDKSG